MDIDKAERINSLMCDLAMHSMGASKMSQVRFNEMTDISLEDMITARNMMRDRNPVDNGDGSKTIVTTVDDRLISAIFSFLNYEPSRDAIIHFNNSALAVIPIKLEAA